MPPVGLLLTETTSPCMWASLVPMIVASDMTLGALRA
jgi:hypothetical protein